MPDPGKDVLEELHNVATGSLAELGLTAFTDATQYEFSL
jgi:hypothetical protein